MTTDQIVFLVILVSSLVLFLTEKLRVDLIGVLIILALTTTGILSEKEALSGFISEPAIIVCAVFVLSAGLSRTGITDQIGSLVSRFSGTSETRVNIVLMTSVAFLSSFTHHVMVTAMMLPIALKICQEKKIPASRVLIPMATAASLGTLLTTFAAPAFLLANNVIVRSGAPRLGVFEVAKVGLPVIAASFLFIIVAKLLLPKRFGKTSDGQQFTLSQLSKIGTEVSIPEKSQWIGKPVSEFIEQTKDRFEVLSRQHDHTTVKAGDTFLIQTTSDELVSIEEKFGLILESLKRYRSKIADNKGSLSGEIRRIFQAMISPKSSLIGNTIAHARFYDRYKVVVVGVWRKNGWIETKITDLPLEAGDILLLWGEEEQLETLSESRNFLLFTPLKASPKLRSKRGLAASIMLLTVAAASMSWLEPKMAFLAGATAMVLFGCVPTKNAYDNIETKIFVMIAGVIPLGIAMSKTGLDQMLAKNFLEWSGGWNPLFILLFFFWIAALLTQILSDAATTALIAPVAAAIAAQSQISITAAVVAVTTGAVASFLTPIGHHGNLLILSPGGYKFRDFIVIGLPLTIIISVVTCYLSIQVWR